VKRLFEIPGGGWKDNFRRNIEGVDSDGGD
jgi:hypothetical protein